MHKPYDVITRTMVETFPGDWLSLLDLDPSWPVRIIDSNLSTLVAEADKVLRVEGPAPGLVHIEVQKDHDASLPRRLLRYNGLLRARHDLPVLSAVVLLMPSADGPAISGRYAEEWPDGRSRVELVYPVVRIWRESASELASSLGTLPLAVLAARDGGEAERVLGPVLTALGRPPTPDEREVVTACYLLAGLRFDEEQVWRIFRGIGVMRESVTYQAILKEGREEGREEGRLGESRRILLRLGTRRFGSPRADQWARVEAIDDASRVEAILDRVLDSASWDDLLAGQP